METNKYYVSVCEKCGSFAFLLKERFNIFKKVFLEYEDAFDYSSEIVDEKCYHCNCKRYFYIEIKLDDYEIKELEINLHDSKFSELCRKILRKKYLRNEINCENENMEKLKRLIFGRKVKEIEKCKKLNVYIAKNVIV